jgi:DNA-binding CsgD family transcriptional regulator
VDYRGGSEPQATEPLEERLRVFAQAHRLSPREGEVLLLLLRGVHPKAIGDMIGCQYTSVRTHIGRMCRKVQCSGARELLLRFFSLSL